MLRPIDADILDNLTAAAAVTARRRKNYNYHQPEDHVQRMLNALEPDSYVRPHKHELPDKVEAFLCLRGQVALIAFNEDGGIASICRMASGGPCFGGEVPPRTWHAIVALQPDSVVYEVKDGPYDPATDKQFAPWAPAEGAADVQNYLEHLRKAVSEGCNAGE